MATLVGFSVITARSKYRAKTGSTWTTGTNPRGANVSFIAAVFCDNSRLTSALVSGDGMKSAGIGNQSGLVALTNSTNASIGDLPLLP